MQVLWPLPRAFGLPGAGQGVGGKGMRGGRQVHQCPTLSTSPPPPGQSSWPWGPGRPDSARCPWLASRGQPAWELPVRTGSWPIFRKQLREPGPAPLCSAFTAGFQTALPVWFCWPLCMLRRFLVKHGILGFCVFGEAEGTGCTIMRLKEFRVVVGLRGWQEAHPLPAPAGEC